MASSGFLKLVCLMLVCMLLGAPMASAAVTCDQVLNALTPCINYVQNGGAVPAECCSGIRNLYGAAQTTPDRQSVCKCLKSAMSEAPVAGANLGHAAELPAKCGVDLPYKMDPNIDCKKIK